MLVKYSTVSNEFSQPEFSKIVKNIKNNITDEIFSLEHWWLIMHVYSLIHEPFLFQWWKALDINSPVHTAKENVQLITSMYHKTELGAIDGNSELYGRILFWNSQIYIPEAYIHIYI